MNLYRSLTTLAVLLAATATSQAQYIVLSPRMETLDQYPEPFSRFVRSHYRLVWTFSDRDEVWERETM